MSTRLVLRTISALVLVTCTPTIGITSDQILTHAEANQAVSELVDAIGPAFDCRIAVKAIRNADSTSQENRYYYVSFEATGERCDEAHKVLSYRGKSKGLWFLRSQKPEREDDLAKEPNLDLIHEVDPPVEQ